jgi:hypothetical protein
MDGLYIANHHGWLWDGNTMKKCFLPAHRVCPSCMVWMFGTLSVGCWFTLANILFQHNVHSFHTNDAMLSLCAMRVGILPHLELDN